LNQALASTSGLEKSELNIDLAKIDVINRCDIMNELMFQVLALILSMLLGVATIYSIRIYLEL
jgi:hypothetical protein